MYTATAATRRRARPSVLWHGGAANAFHRFHSCGSAVVPEPGRARHPSASATPGLIIAFSVDDRRRRSRKKKRRLRRIARKTPGWRRRNPKWTSGRQTLETVATRGGGQRPFNAALENTARRPLETARVVRASRFLVAHNSRVIGQLARFTLSIWRFCIFASSTLLERVFSTGVDCGGSRRD